MAKKKTESLLSYYSFTKSDQKKYSVVAGILRELTPERIKKEIEEIKKVELPPELQKWVKEYEKVGERDGFIWNLWYQIFKNDPSLVFLKSVKKNEESFISIRPVANCELLLSSRSIKLLITMFVVQIDDIADNKQYQKLLNELLKIPFKKDNIKIKHLSTEDKKYFIFTQKLWNYIEKQIRNYPNYKELKEIFAYDISQIFNTMKYSFLINKNSYLINKTEHWLYLPNNMAFMIGLMINLMGAEKFYLKKIGILRKTIYEAQKMGRISNWITTWQREVKNDDFTSGVFVYAIDKNILTPNDFKAMPKNKIIDKIKKAKIENILLKEWEAFYNKIKYNFKKNILINKKSFLNWLKYLLVLDLSSRDYK